MRPNVSSEAGDGAVARLRAPSVLMIAPYFFPPSNAEAIVNAKLVSAMRDAGWSVRVVTEHAVSNGYYPGAEAGWGAIAEVAEPVRRTGTLRAYAGVASMLARIEPTTRTEMEWMVPAIAAGVRLARRERFDVVLSRAVPESSHFIGYAVAARSGLRWIANWNDPLPWVKQPPPYGGGPGAAWPMTQRWRYRSFIRRASWHVFPSERLRRYVASYMPGNLLAKSSVIPHVAWGGARAAATRSSAVFTLCHAGDLRPPRDPLPLLRAVRALLDTHSDARVAVRLIGVVDDAVRFMVDRLRLQGVVSLEPPVPYSEALARLAASDVALILEADAAEGIFFPSKLVDYAELGRPVLAIGPRHSTVRDFLERHRAGLAADIRSEEEVSRAVDALFSAWRSGELRSRYDAGRILGEVAPAKVLGAYEDLLSRI